MAEAAPMRVLVCGGRNYVNMARLTRALDTLLVELGGISRIITGGAAGADTMAGDWAIKNSIRVHTIPADWRTHGNSAGPIRNQRMLDEEKPDLVIAFPGGPGTADMVARAKKAGIPVREVA